MKDFKTYLLRMIIILLIFIMGILLGKNHSPTTVEAQSQCVQVLVSCDWSGWMCHSSGSGTLPNSQNFADCYDTSGFEYVHFTNLYCENGFVTRAVKAFHAWI